jgi:hypothetical protein
VYTHLVVSGGAAQGAIKRLLQSSRAGFGGVGAARSLGSYLLDFCGGGRLDGSAVVAECRNKLSVASGQLARHLHLSVQLGIAGLQLRDELARGLLR